jgi:hypothetical protein
MPDAAAHPTGAEGAAVATRSGKPGWLKRLLSWQKHLTGTIGLDREPTGHGRRNAWIIVAAAVVVGSSLGVQDWQSVWDKPYLGRYLGVDAVAALVLTPLALTIYLSLREIATRLLRRLDHNGVIDCAAGGKSLNQFALEMDGWLDHWWVWVPTVVVTAGYFTYMLLDELNEMTSPLGTLLIVITLVVLAALFYVGVVAIAQIGVACWAIGGLFRKFSEFEISVQPLHPDGCGGLRPIGHMLSLVLSVAAILGGASLCIFLTVEATPPGPTRRPEPYLLAAFYAILLPLAFLNLVWWPHHRMYKRRKEFLTPVAEEFKNAIIPARPSHTDDSQQLKAKADSLSEISRQFRVLDDACPVWPLQLRRLQAVLATAILPVAIPVLTAIVLGLLKP